MVGKYSGKHSPVSTARIPSARIAPRAIVPSPGSDPEGRPPEIGRKGVGSMRVRERDEFAEDLGPKYRRALRIERGQLLDSLCLATGFGRNYALRRPRQSSSAASARPGARVNSGELGFCCLMTPGSHGGPYRKFLAVERPVTTGYH